MVAAVPDSPRVAVAASGLGHIARGVEAWASDVAAALRRRGIPVELFGAAPGDHIRPLGCLRRTAASNRALVGVFRRLGGWRYGIGSVYELEQLTFALSLWRAVRRDFDVVHLQDPLVARILDRLHRAGLSRPRVILGNGTGETVERLRSYSVVQELLPPSRARWDGEAPPLPALYQIPNFIDLATFSPGSKREARAAFDLPQDAFVVLCSAAIRRYHKRIDYLIGEFARFRRNASGPVFLVVVGGRESDTDELIAMGRGLLGDDVRFIVGAPRERMPLLYRTADVFALTSLFETGSIAVLEAIGTGLPAVCHDAPVFHALAGPSNTFVDMEVEGALAAALADLAAMPDRSERGRASRDHATATFSEEVVIARMITMYREVLAGAVAEGKARGV